MRRFELGRVILLLSLAGACRNVADSKSQGGHLDAGWIGADTGQISAPAVAEWCDEQRLLQIRAIRGDTGLALAVYPGPVLSPDTYRVRLAVGADSVVPSARVALRWLGPTAINGFQGDSGVVVLERTDSGQLSGSVKARARSVSNSQRVTVTGEFRDLDVFSESRGCNAPSDTVEQELGADADEVD